MSYYINIKSIRLGIHFHEKWRTGNISFKLSLSLFFYISSSAKNNKKLKKNREKKNTKGRKWRAEDRP